jgi:hypothetical protein
MPTAYHAKFYAYDLTRRASTGLDRLSMSLFDAAVDLNPHQIEAALFALESPLSKGVLLADEVGLGKTIEAGIVLCQFWAERKRRLLVICPASLRKQWALELLEKFNLPTRVLDAKTFKDEQRLGRAPLNEKAVLVVSFNYACALRDEVKAIAWDLVVVDEAHKLRNAYRLSNKVGQGIRWATEDSRKLLLTATPLQNSLIELYGLSTLIDEHLFGEINAFRARYASAGSSITDLRQRLATFCKRTLRNEVTEYVRYTERRAITRPFTPNDAEHSLYEAVRRACPLTPRPPSAWRSPWRTFFGCRRSRRRRLRWRTRQLRPNGAQQPDAWRQRIAIVSDHSVQKAEEGIVNLTARGMLVGVGGAAAQVGRSFARLLCCAALTGRGRKKAP